MTTIDTKDFLVENYPLPCHQNKDFKSYLRLLFECLHLKVLASPNMLILGVISILNIFL